jgi:hypothetical protein
MCVALTLGLVAGCSSTADVISGEPEELLVALMAEVNATFTDGFRGESDYVPVTADNSEFALGLTPEQFTANVQGAFQARAMMMTTAETAILVHANDAGAAKEVAALIAAGFDSTQWICVMPDRSVVVTAGSWVFLAVGATDVVEAMVAAFDKLAKGTAGEPNVFYTGITG